MQIKGTRCQSEHEQHGNAGCENTATRQVATIYGKYLLCRLCAESMPADFRAPNDVASRLVFLPGSEL